MMKKVLSFFMALCLCLTALPCSVFALDELGQIEAAMKAVRKAESTLEMKNDMTSDSFLEDIKLILPDESTVELSFSKETDYRVSNATSEKDGSIFANILFTCGPYTRHDIYTMKIPKLTGASAEANADKENLAKDIAAANEIFKGVSLDANVTADDILNSVKAVIKYGSTVELTGDFTKVDSTETKKGSVKCFIKFTLNKETSTLKVYNTLRLLDSAALPETKPETVKPAAFSDVADGAYYADAVKWAVGKSITQGTSATTFSPDLTCTRAQILTFLWRAVGSPKAESANPYTDVTSADYFYDAAIWAYQKGMVSGNLFEGNTPCTRASTVMYLWKNAGSPALGNFEIFDDVSEDSEYCTAVFWAVENNITSGVSETEFAPAAICSRGQIVTFLKRAFEE